MLTDGALRMLVLLHFHTLGFTPIQLAGLFVLYEVAGIVTNLTAGWLAARFGLASTLHAGLGLQIAALLALTALDPDWSIAASVAFVMGVQGASGIAKDLAKTSSKSAVKLLAPDDGLFRWVAALTGSKNAIKGAGFFLGAALLASLGFGPALIAMAVGLTAIWALVTLFLPAGLRAGRKAKFSEVFSGNPRINRLAAARLFLFGARDVWFVVALPIWLYAFMAPRVGEDSAFFATGGFMALWIIGYGAVQAATPRLVRKGTSGSALLWCGFLAGLTACLALSAALRPELAWIVLAGLLAFGAVFAVNSSLHSYLILAFSRAGRVTMDVGFYYMANAGGRLLGTILSGLVYQVGGLPAALWVSTAMLVASWFALRTIPREDTAPA
ncbi:organoarsenical effux MFS transporter ArsJ [Jannaschia aquimarina]